MSILKMFVLITVIMTGFVSAVWGQAAQGVGGIRSYGKDLGLIEQRESDAKPGKEIQELGRLHPEATVLVVLDRVQVNENVTYFYKWFYDRAAKKLVCMRRISMRTLDDDFDWSIWDGISLAEIGTGQLFSSAYERQLTLSEPKKAKQTFPVSYRENPAITDWP